jgi:hypothetical protein
VVQQRLAGRGVDRTVIGVYSPYKYTQCHINAMPIRIQDLELWAIWAMIKGRFKKGGKESY